MNIFRRLFGSADKALPIDLQDVPLAIQDLYEKIEELRKDQAINNTALNRIERKQNRWVEVLNSKSGENPELEAQAQQLIKEAETVARAYSPGDIIPDNESYE